ncbi:hypothetical protein FHW88_006012 [Mucilaginibacter sp. SG538B]|uniref:hypothetical protein n=1 Tax=Mucilaginibacter sp. SG538B TaxID=2587021 RepID=UPI00159D3C52|nr:hypothetical protein [Mucilaginibacter sp. SG538B]NVM67684.1 hypothetical protein [Mucilaginibacter sp. SG538B]
METLNMEIKNTAPVLTNLLQIVESGLLSENIYLTLTDEGSEQSLSGLRINKLGVTEAPIPEILKLLGIRSITLNASHDFTELSKLTVTLPPAEVEQYLWTFFRDKTVIAELRSLFSNCHTIAFDDWAAITGASNLWNGLLAEVIRPLGKKDLEFIFYLGDPGNKLSFQVDEAIDLISEFSHHGQVTFALDASEAMKLWMVLNGVNPDTPLEGQTPSDLNKKYFSIYRTMDVSRLLIYSADNAILFSSDQQFVLSRKKVEHHIEISANARQDFIAGFSIGLLKHLDIAHCIALGLIVFGCYGEFNSKPDQQDLSLYIQNWIKDLEKPDSIHLYE